MTRGSVTTARALPRFASENALTITATAVNRTRLEVFGIMPSCAPRIMAFSLSIGQNSPARGAHMKGRLPVFALVTCGWMAVAWSSVQSSAPQGPPASTSAASPDIKATLDRYCITCHSQRLATAGVVLEGIDTANPVARAELWERVITKLRARSMPPAGLPRPDAATYHAIARSEEHTSELQ